MNSGRQLLLVALLASASASLGCPAFHARDRDLDRTPIVNTGAGATILYPGHAPPVYQGAQHPLESGKGSYGSPGSSQRSGTSSPSGTSPSGTTPARSEITMIGGATTEVELHQRVDVQPVWWKYVTLPFAVVAAPFIYVADQLATEPEPGPPVPTLENTQPPEPTGPPPVDYETAALKRLEAELDQRAAANTPAPTGGSLAAELAALRSAKATPTPTRAPRPALRTPAPERAAPTPIPTPAPNIYPGLATASGHVDRDGDGRTDHWIFRERGEILRELLDDDFDGRPDRTLHYDLASHQVRAIEEDANHDGQIDTWTSLRDGVVMRRRADGNADGHVDTWSYYRKGDLTRLERDATGDGFRDRVSHYVDGHLTREEQDDDADGRADAVKYYDEHEQILRLEEDTDGDGEFDVISHYAAGRLTRRELLDAKLLTPTPRMTN